MNRIRILSLLPSGDAGEPWLVAALAIAAAAVFAIYVIVLSQDVRRATLRRAQADRWAQAELDCERDEPAATRGACLSLLTGGDPATVRTRQVARAQPENDLLPSAGRPRAGTLAVAALSAP